MRFKVYEKSTDREITDNRDWFIDEDGYLRYYDTDTRKLAVAEDDCYYKIEFIVF